MTDSVAISECQDCLLFLKIRRFIPGSLAIQMIAN